MTQTVTLPIWLLVLIVLFATVTFASHFLFPSVRWFFRKRAERVIARVNQRLQRPIEPFKLARRHDMIQRLIYDPEVTQAVYDHAKSDGVPEQVAFEKAKKYAREIVPSFSATAYFSIGMRVARWLSRSLYRVRVGAFDLKTLKALDPDATVIFVMNHRSNMDYVLVTHLVSTAGALSYAVGEWARVWPLSPMIRAMGAYFIRRKSRGALYRKVLARYVQMATAGGVTQAMFPEGALSLDGRIGAPKLGLLSYIVAGRQPGGRDVVFVPVALNYDRVLEDKFLIKAGTTGVRRFRPPVSELLSGAGQHLWRRVTRRFKNFGTASVGFGAPLSMASFDTADADPTAAVAEELMKRIAKVVPVLGVPLVARVLTQDGPMSRDGLIGAVATLVADCDARGLVRPSRPAMAVVEDVLVDLGRRGLITQVDGQVAVTDEGRDVLMYYAHTISHLFEAKT